MEKSVRRRRSGPPPQPASAGCMTSNAPGFQSSCPRARPGGEGSFSAVIEGTLLGNYRFVKYKSEPPVALDAIEFVGSGVAPHKLRRLEAVCAATSYVRDLVNENASIMTPERLAAEARALGRGGKLRVTILDEKEIAAKGLHLLKAVGQGSATPPRLIVIEYAGNLSSKEKTEHYR